MSITSDMVRTGFGKGDDLRDAGLRIPEDVERYTDLSYGTDPNWQVLDVYRPKARSGEKLPVIVSVHGGAWVYGDKERYQYYCMSLSQMGFAVVNFTYRLAPEFKFPAPLEDTNLVMKWVLAHGAEYDMDLMNIFAVGDSAGAHILGLYTAIYTNLSYAKTYDFQVPAGLHLRAIALNSGCYRLDLRGGPDDLTVRLMADFLPHGGDEAELHQINVENHMTGSYLPTIFATCVEDFLKAQAPILERQLVANDIPHAFLFFGTKQRPLRHVFQLSIREPEAQLCNRAECAFFRSYIK